MLRGRERVLHLHSELSNSAELQNDNSGYLLLLAHYVGSRRSYSVEGARVSTIEVLAI